MLDHWFPSASSLSVILSMYGKNPVYEPLPKGATRREQPSKIKEEGETSARRSSLRDGHTNNAESEFIVASVISKWSLISE